MFKRLIFPAVVALCLAAPVALFGQAATTTCADGTKSTATGKGACSSHGGVKNSSSKTTSSKSHQDADKKEASEPKTASSSSAKGEKGEKGEKQVKCGDGSMSAGGQGACSHHGGVAKGGESESKGKSSASSASSPKGSSESHGTAGKESDKGDNTKAEGATAKCKDGSYSHAKQHSGACSKHGGVDKWMDGSKS